MTNKPDLLWRVQNALRDANVSKVSRDTGLAYVTVKSIKRGAADPKWSTMRVLVRYFNL